MFLGTGVTSSVTQAEGASTGGTRASPKTLVVLVKMKDSPPMHNSIVAYRRLDAGKPEGIVAAFLGLLTTIE